MTTSESSVEASTVAELRSEADDVICLEDHEFFVAISAYYADFRQVSDQEVIDILKRFSVQSLSPAIARRVSTRDVVGRKSSP
jgi:predicted phosphoribosyltransferase